MFSNVMRAVTPVVTAGVASTMGQGNPLSTIAGATGIVWSTKDWVLSQGEYYMGRRALTNTKVKSVLEKQGWMGTGLQWIIQDLKRFHPVYWDLIGIQDNLVPGRMLARSAQWLTRVVVDFAGDPQTLDRDPEDEWVALFMKVYDAFEQINAKVALEGTKLGEITPDFMTETIRSINQDPTTATNRWIEATQAQLRRIELEVYTRASRKTTVLDDQVIPLLAQAGRALDQLGGKLTQFQHQNEVYTQLVQPSASTDVVSGALTPTEKDKSNRINLLYTWHEVYDATRLLMWDTLMTFSTGVEGLSLNALNAQTFDVAAYTLHDVDTMEANMMNLITVFTFSMFRVLDQRASVQTPDTEEMQVKGLEAIKQMSWLVQFAGDCRAWHEALSTWNSMTPEERDALIIPAVFIPRYRLEAARLELDGPRPHLPYSLAPPVDRIGMGFDVVKGLIQQGMDAPVFSIEWRASTGRLWGFLDRWGEDYSSAMALPSVEDATALVPVSLVDYESRCRNLLEKQLATLSTEDTELRDACIKGIQRFDNGPYRRQMMLADEFKAIINTQTPLEMRPYAVKYAEAIRLEAIKPTPDWGYFAALDHSTLLRLEAIPPTTPLEDLEDALKGSLSYVRAITQQLEELVTRCLWELTRWMVGSLSVVTLVHGPSAVPALVGKSWSILSMVMGTVSRPVLNALVGVFSGLYGLGEPALESLWGVLRLLEQPTRETRKALDDKLERLINLVNQLKLTATPRPMHMDLPSELYILKCALCVAMT